MVIAEYLRHCGFKVIEAVNADEALLILQESELQVDVVFSDVEMPGSMDGFALAKWIRANRPGTDVILAGSPSRAANAAGNLCENGPALSKPYEPQVVLDRIRRLLARRASPK
jgi:CheY-like chemotaxis protein